jgi:hypothetical protein
MRLAVPLVEYGGVIMGRRDYRHREPKKAKKDVKKSLPVNILTTPINTEIVRKERKNREVEEA